MVTHCPFLRFSAQQPWAALSAVAVAVAREPIPVAEDETLQTKRHGSVTREIGEEIRAYRHRHGTATHYGWATADRWGGIPGVQQGDKADSGAGSGIRT
jgi:hypothetical protein